MKKISVILAMLIVTTMLFSGCGMYQKTADDVSDDIIDQVSSQRIEQPSIQQTSWTYDVFHVSLPFESKN